MNGQQGKRVGPSTVYKGTKFFSKTRSILSHFAVPNLAVPCEGGRTTPYSITILKEKNRWKVRNVLPGPHVCVISKLM